jgi:hypothetical protein
VTAEEYYKKLIEHKGNCAKMRSNCETCPFYKTEFQRKICDRLQSMYAKPFILKAAKENLEEIKKLKWLDKLK